MTTTHTPGPWRYVLGWPEPDTPEYQVLGDDDRTVTARTYSEDDARLIAQAPQMLAALKQLEREGNWTCTHREGTCKYCDARAAIAEAERGTP